MAKGQVATTSPIPVEVEEGKNYLKERSKITF